MNTQINSAGVPQRLPTVRDAADRLGVCTDTVRNHMRRGTLRKITLSPRCVRVCPASLERLVTGGVELGETS